MDSARTSKELNFLSSADREKLSGQAKSELDAIEKISENEKHEEEENFRRCYEHRVNKAEDIMLREPSSTFYLKMTLTIDGKPVEPPTVWAREDLSPQQARDLRKAAEQKVARDHEANLDRIEQTGEDKQRALLDRELGPHRYDRDRSYRDVGGTGRDDTDRAPSAAAAARGAADLGGSSLDPETVDDAYIQKVEAYQAEHEREPKGPPSGLSGNERADDDLNFSAQDSGAPQLCEEPAFEWTPERTASFYELKEQHETERAHDHDIGPEHA